LDLPSPGFFPSDPLRNWGVLSALPNLIQQLKVDDVNVAYIKKKATVPSYRSLIPNQRLLNFFPYCTGGMLRE
jgi:hypothetical protein